MLLVHAGIPAGGPLGAAGGGPGGGVPGGGDAGCSGGGALSGPGPVMVTLRLWTALAPAGQRRDAVTSRVRQHNHVGKPATGVSDADRANEHQRGTTHELRTVP